MLRAMCSYGKWIIIFNLHILVAGYGVQAWIFSSIIFSSSIMLWTEREMENEWHKNAAKRRGNLFDDRKKNILHFSYEIP